MLLSNIRNWPQRFEADCLVACSAMVLDYLGISREYDWLTKALETSDIGTPFSNIEKLAELLNIIVELDNTETLETFEPIVESGLPVIVAVDSDSIEYWPHYQNHAVVVIGFNKDSVFINNPAMGDAPEDIPIDTFMWAWSRRSFEFAVIRLV